jgi:hypothetical protein
MPFGWKKRAAMGILSLAEGSMKRSILLGLALVLAVPATSHGADTDKHEALIKDMIKGLDDLGDALESVKDKDTAKTAAVKINKVCDRMTEIGKKAQDLPKLSKDEDAALEKKYKPQLEKVAARIQKVAFAAGMASGGEPDFIKSCMRLEEVGKNLQKVGLGK